MLRQVFDCACLQINQVQVRVDVRRVFANDNPLTILRNNLRTVVSFLRKNGTFLARGDIQLVNVKVLPIGLVGAVVNLGVIVGPERVGNLHILYIGKRLGPSRCHFNQMQIRLLRSAPRRPGNDPLAVVRKGVKINAVREEGQLFRPTVLS